MSIVLVGSTSGSVTLQEPAVAGTTVLDLPATSGTILTSASAISASSITTGTLPAARLPAGSVLQVVQSVYKTYSSRTSSTYADTGLTASITPTSASNKILVLVTMNGCGKASSDTALALKLLRGSTDLTLIDDSIGGTGTSVSLFVGSSSINYLDSPATTSSTAYKVQFASVSNTAAAYFNNYSGTVNTVTSTMTLMEIAA
jgi:hypothetical protein